MTNEVTELVTLMGWAESWFAERGVVEPQVSVFPFGGHGSISWERLSEAKEEVDESRSFHAAGFSTLAVHCFMLKEPMNLSGVPLPEVDRRPVGWCWVVA